MGTDSARILLEATRLFHDDAECPRPADVRSLGGDGQAAARIVARLRKDLT